MINEVLLGMVIEVKLEFANANGSITERLDGSVNEIETDWSEPLSLNALCEMPTTLLGISRSPRHPTSNLIA